MNKLLVLGDKIAITLSGLCTVHCLILPLLVIAMPSVAALGLTDEAFHFWMLAAVIPTSLYALTLGCKSHKRYRVLTIGILGLACLLLAITGEHVFGAYALLGEKALTLIGSILLIVGHVLNFSLCKQQDHKCDKHLNSDEA